MRQKVQQFLFFFQGQRSKGGISVYPRVFVNSGLMENTSAERAAALAPNCLTFTYDALARHRAAHAKHAQRLFVFWARYWG